MLGKEREKDGGLRREKRVQVTQFNRLLLLLLSDRLHFEARVSERGQNIVIHGLRPGESYQLVVTRDEEVVLDRAMKLGKKMLLLTRNAALPFYSHKINIARGLPLPCPICLSGRGGKKDRR